MKDLVEYVRDRAVKAGADFMDVRVVEDNGTSIQLQDGRADRVNRWIGEGMGIRVLKDRAWGFASTNRLDRGAADECLAAALEMAEVSKERTGELGVLAEAEPVVETVEAEADVDPRSVAVGEKMRVLSQFEKAAVAVGEDKLVNTRVFYADQVTRETLCNTRGTLLVTERVRTRLGASMTAGEGDLRQQGFEHRSGQRGWELMQEITPEEVSVKAAKMAVALLSAKRAPAGKFPVIFHPDIAGIFIHEAFGHNAEADLVLAGESILEGKLGTKIASDLVTVVDDSTVPGRWGSYQYDSEGVPGKRRVLIEKGELKGFMHSLETAHKFGVAPSGSARADGYANRPIVRMSNTSIERGEVPYEEMLKAVDCGILLKGGQWGYVMCEKGQYTCHAGEGWMIRNGELAQHLRDVSVCGMILETLMNVTALSKEFEWEQTGGMCGKNGQGMPVSGGGPYVLVGELVVGGQE